MNLSQKILSDLTIFSKYAKYIPELKRRETWDEICSRVENMHIKKYPELKKDIIKAITFVRDKKVVPSMRSMQFAGKPIELNHSRIFNCSFSAIQSWKDFSEAMFLLLSGVGFAYSVQNRYINKLPTIKKPIKSKKYLIGDSIEGWADAIRALFKAYMAKGYLPLFDYSDIRPKGAQLITAGGKAPGPEPLERCLNKIKSILDKKNEGEQLLSIEIHDIICLIADAVLSGGIRRAACLALFDNDDKEMLRCKSNFKVQILNGGFHFNQKSKLWEGEVLYKNKAQFISLDLKTFEKFNETKELPWYYFEPQRARANNSIVFLRSTTEKEEYEEIWNMIKENGAGEPGMFWTDSLEYGCNPCAEILFSTSRSYCNLTEVNMSNITSQEDFKERLWAATLIGTLQAGYTDFHYISDKWKINAEKEALLGVSLTGICDDKNYIDYDWNELTDYIKEVNKEYIQKIGINISHRITTIKPSGTAALVLGTSSGIHARYAPFYIRRMRYNKNEPIAQYLMINLPELVEEEFGNSNGVVVSIPIKSPETSIFRTESAIETLNRVKFFHTNWTQKGKVIGDLNHNVSCTINIKNNEWNKVEKWMWDNKDDYNAIAVLPDDNGTYKQSPFEECDEKTYNRLISFVKDIDLTKVIEELDVTDLKGELACSSGSCEISF